MSTINFTITRESPGVWISSSGTDEAETFEHPVKAIQAAYGDAAWASYPDEPDIFIDVIDKDGEHHPVSVGPDGAIYYWLPGPDDL